MAKFEVGQRVRIKVGKRSNEEATVNSLPGVGHQSFTNYLLDTSEGELLYMESELEPISTVFRPGDIVRAEKGDDAIQGYIRKYEEGVFALMVWSDQLNLDLDDLESDGYTLTLVKRPEPEIVLPTKPYAFIHFNSNVYIFDSVLGFWVSIDDSRTFAGNEILKTIANVDDYRVIFEGENE